MLICKDASDGLMYWRKIQDLFTVTDITLYTVHTDIEILLQIRQK